MCEITEQKTHEDIAEAVYAELNRLNIAYSVVEHEAAATMQDCAAIEKQIGAMVCKNLFLCNRQQTDFYLLLMPGDKPFKTKYLSEQIGSSRLSFADADQMMELLHAAPGSASAFCLMFDSEHRIRLLVDSDLLQEDFLGCHPCRNTATVKIATGDLLNNFAVQSGHSYTLVRLPKILPQE